MSRILWKLDQLKAELGSRKQVKGWIITQDHTSRRERYFMSEKESLAVDQDRDVRSQNISLKLLVDIGKGGRQGEITKKLYPTLSLKDQLDSAIASASQTDHQAWELPASPPRNLPQRRSADPRMAEDLEGVVAELTSRIGQLVRAKRNTRFNSAELFLSVHDRELHLSNGLVHRSAQSRIYVESAFSFSKKIGGQEVSDEYLNTAWSVSLQDLDLDRLFNETSDRAEHSLDVIKPVTGTYPVIVDAEVLATIFHDKVSQLSAFNSYNGLPFIPVGEELIPNAHGDLLTIELDPSLEFGGDTAAVSDQGVAQEPLKLVEANRVVGTMADKQYADYLNMKPSSVRGNLVVRPGTLSHEELTRQAPQVIEILQFSGLFSDASSGTFSSEIRLARLYDNRTGKVSYLKGGSVSGSVRENLRGARFSNRTAKRAHFSSGSPVGHGYLGPEYALLSDVSVVG